ncbi:MAG: 23S rRNA (uracil(1939)-C(5))-methyltransferase RlmD [candidate division KSB1 bacterium]|nr:23S rRNA (uracil(1939)-C(5))-methyltransferase RlmD [candidate division KSB1 bacterium]MDZ7341977.1 23S rRNA (uracil(1939)-C(5))-methyltransferase RlmD [candidate division KSB1 bacterium]
MHGLKPRDIVELNIESLALGGKGVAHIDGFAVFVERALPGQKIKAEIKRKKSNFAEARVVEIVTHSPNEVTPSCGHFGSCGGCLLQHLDYEEQLRQKQQQVRESLAHIGGFQQVDVSPVLPAPDIYFYRNKMEFSFSRQRWLTVAEIQSNQPVERNFALGLHTIGSFEKVLNIDACQLLSEPSNLVLRWTRDFARQSGLLPYSTKDHSGFWRFLVFKESKRRSQMMVNVVTADHPQAGRLAHELVAEMVQRFPFITTVVHNINRKKAQIALGDQEFTIHGPGFIEETIGSKTYRISANSFFQTNTRQAERMYQLLADWGQFQPDQIVYDLYSGTGSIAIFIAEQVGQVIGFEILPQAIADARLNCQLNSIDNCRFVEGDLKDALKDPATVVEQYGQPNIVIIDPPRSGLHPKLPGKILQLKPQRIIYVSCNPATLARDLQLLCQQEFDLIRVQPIDMFPHTAHCEAVALLERR